MSDLQNGPVRKRRLAASALAQVAESRSLGEVAVERLREHLVDEQDRLVWQFCIAAIMKDDTDAGAQLALLATNSTWPDVRRLGCEYIARHPRPAYAHWLIPLFGDSSRNVQYLAVDAAGRCRNPSILYGGASENPALSQPGLKSLLTSSDRELRFRTAVALTLLGDTAGEDELLRLVYEPNIELRTQAVRAMAETGRTRFRRHLANAAWTEDNDRVRHVMLEGLLQLTPQSERPPALSKAKNDDARAEAWATWSQGHASTAPTTDGPGPTFRR